MYLMGCFTCCILLKYLFVNLQLSSFQKAKQATLLVQSSNSEMKNEPVARCVDASIFVRRGECRDLAVEMMMSGC